MRKHDVRKWIHAVLDMLPLFIIPIFAIYMHRHPSTDYEVNYTELSSGGVSYTRKFTTNTISSIDDMVVDNTYQLSLKVYKDGYTYSSFIELCYLPIYTDNEVCINRPDHGSYSRTKHQGN